MLKLEPLKPPPEPSSPASNPTTASLVHWPKRKGWNSCRLVCSMASEIVSTAEIGKAHLRRRMTQQQGTANRAPDQTNSETVRGIEGRDSKGYERMPCIPRLTRNRRVGGRKQPSWEKFHPRSRFGSSAP